MNYKHGLIKHPLCKVWDAMKQRCYNINDKDYHYYGARGIIVYNEWRNNFMAFYKWAIDKWKPGLQIDRINNDGNYCPENCRFITCRANLSNKRNTSIYGTGIYKNGKGFIIRITDKNGKRQNFGTYSTIERAQEVYQLSLQALKLKKS